MNVKNNDKKEDDLLEMESDIEEDEDDLEEDEKENTEYLEEDEDFIEEDEDVEAEDDLELKESEKQQMSSSKIMEEEFSEGNYETEDESDEEEVDENYLQKFNDNLNIKSLENIHPEIKSINYEEMIALARIVRDKNGKIIDPLHKTLPFMTKYERARIIGARAEELDAGCEAYIPLDETIINGKTIALMEFEQKKIPFIIARPLPNGSTEYWHVSDLENILD
jgi:DNA-directed RNA polymerase I, II, and III subunit RPABC2